MPSSSRHENKGGFGWSRGLNYSIEAFYARLAVQIYIFCQVRLESDVSSLDSIKAHAKRFLQIRSEPHSGFPVGNNLVQDGATGGECTHTVPAKLYSTLKSPNGWVVQSVGWLTSVAPRGLLIMLSNACIHCSMWRQIHIYYMGINMN